MGITHLMPILVSLATVFEQEPQDVSTSRCCPLRRHINPSNEPTPGPMNYREAVWKFVPSSGTSAFLVTPYEGQKMNATTKSDARRISDRRPKTRVRHGVRDDPTTVATRKYEPKPPKVIRDPGLSEAPACPVKPLSYFAGPIFTSSGKIDAAVSPVVGETPPPNNFVSIAYEMRGKDTQPKNVPVCSEIWFECNGLSVSAVVSQRLKCRHTEQKTCIAAACIADMMDMALLEQSIEASAEPLWLLVVLMISAQAFLRTANGIFTACMQRKWLARAVLIWMLVGTTIASPIVAASISSPAPMLVAKFHTLETAKDRMIVQKDATIRQKDATIENQHAAIRQLCLLHQLEDDVCTEAGFDQRYAGSTSPPASPTATPTTAMKNKSVLNSATVLPSATMLPSSTNAGSLTNMRVVNTTTVAMRRLLTEVSNWAEMKTACGSSGTVALSDDFVMGTYTPTPSPLYGGIDFSGKHLVIIGNSKTLDAGEKG
jgi:hypothetical protein